MRRVCEAAIVLQRHPLGESDWRLGILGAESGKLAAVAPGARRSKKRFAGGLDLFCELDAVLVDRGRGGLWRLEEARLIDGHVRIRQNLVAIAHAGYVAELTSGLLQEGQEAAQVYALLRSALQRLDRGPMSHLDLRRFELQSLESAGVAPALDACLSCGLESSESWFFDHDQGGLVCPSCPVGTHHEKLSAKSAELLRRLQAGELGLLADPGTEQTLRVLLGRLIDAQVGRPLKAREFLRQLACCIPDKGA